MIKKTREKIIVRTFLSVSSIIMIAKILGFVKQMVVAGAFGANSATDIISLAEGLTANIEYVIVQTLITAFVPVYIRAKARQDGSEKCLIADSLHIFPLCIAILTVLVMLASPLLARIIAPTYDPARHDKLARYLRILSPVLVVYTIQALFHALLNANERFVPGQLIGFNQSVLLIGIVLLLGDRMGPDALVVGYLLCPFANMCFLGFCSRRQMKWKGGSFFRLSEDMRSLLRMLGPLLLGYAVIFINQQVDKIIVSGMETGTVTAMHYGQTLSNFVTTLIGTFCTILYTRISQRTVSGEQGEASALVMRTSSILITLFVPISMIAVLCSRDIVTIVFARGAFDEQAVSNAANALSGYCICFIPFAIKGLFARFQYGKQDSKRPMINNSVGIGFNIVASLLLHKQLGVFGVTLASSMAELLSGILNIISSVKQDSSFRFRLWLRLLPSWVIGGTMCAVVVILERNWLSSFGPLPRFIMIAFSGSFVYAVILLPCAMRLKKRGQI